MSSTYLPDINLCRKYFVVKVKGELSYWDDIINPQVPVMLGPADLIALTQKMADHT